MFDYKDLIEELRAEFNKLEAAAGARLHALLDALISHGPAVEAEVTADTGHVAGEVAATAASAVEGEPRA